jgi:hypothetical protein
MYGQHMSPTSLTNAAVPGTGASSAGLALNGYNDLAIFLAAVTLLLVAFTVVQLLRRSGRVRP